MLTTCSPSNTTPSGIRRFRRAARPPCAVSPFRGNNARCGRHLPRAPWRAGARHRRQGSGWKRLRVREGKRALGAQYLHSQAHWESTTAVLLAGIEHPRSNKCARLLRDVSGRSPGAHSHTGRGWAQVPPRQGSQNSKSQSPPFHRHALDTQRCPLSSSHRNRKSACGKAHSSKHNDKGPPTAAPAPGSASPSLPARSCRHEGKKLAAVARQLLQ